MNIKLIILLLISIPAVTALSLASPSQKDYIFQGTEKLELKYVIPNSGSTTLPIRIEFDAGSLSDYIKTDNYEFEILPGDNTPFVLTFEPPDGLPPGYYPVKISVMEKTRGAGTISASIGINDYVNFIKLHESGTPYASISAREVAGANNQMPIGIKVLNIGKTILSGISAEIAILDGTSNLEQTSAQIPELTSLKEFATSLKINTPDPGIYTLQVKFEGNSYEQLITQELQIGKPEIHIEDLQFTPGKSDSIQIPINLLWPNPIPAQIAEFVIYHAPTEKILYRARNSIDVLQPGQNKLTFSEKIPALRSGAYPASITILSPPNNFVQNFKIDISSDVQENTEEHVEESDIDQSPIGAPVVPNVSSQKSSTFILILLALLGAVFFFSIAQLIKPKKPEVEIIEPPSPR